MALLVNSVPLSETMQAGFPVDADQCVQRARHPGPRDAGVGDQAEVFAAAVFIYCQDVELPAGPERVGQKVQRLALVRPQEHWHRCSSAARPFAATAAVHRQALFRHQIRLTAIEGNRLSANG